MSESPPPPRDQEVDHEAQDLFRDLDEEEPPEVGNGSARSPSARADPETAEGAPSETSSLVERLCRIDMCEVFSPPRVGLEAAKFGLKVGDAMDLTTGWDFNNEEDCKRAEDYMD